MRRYNTGTLVRDALALTSGSTLVVPLCLTLLSLFGLFVTGDDTPEYAALLLFFLTTMLWPFWLGGLLRDGWGRVVLLLPMKRRSSATALVLLATLLPVLWALIWAALIFLLFSLTKVVNWTLLLQWASLQYCVLSGIFLLHAMASVGYFPGLLAGRSRPLRGWRWGLILAAHCLILLPVMAMTTRMTEEDLWLAYALLASGAVFSALGVARLRSLAAGPSAARRPRSLADYLPGGLGTWTSARTQFSFGGSGLVWLGLLARNTLIASCLVVCWLLLEIVLAGGYPEVSPDCIQYWALVLSLLFFWSIQPVVRALRAVRLLPWSRAGLGCWLVSISIGSFVSCVGLLTLAVVLVADRETAEACLPVLMGIAGASSLVIPSYLYGGRGVAAGVLFWVWWLHFLVIPPMVQIWSRGNWSDWSWYPPFGVTALVLGMIFTWRAAGMARHTLRPAMPAS
ncbi:MAG: hypothetical protein OXH45_09535 [Gammaproteobacteria bacterium]|nr:hypothetical protein [Gammaproteobacteria bacterium]